MDWYYPVLGGALRGERAARRLAERWDRFVVPGLGVRCVADRPWVTGAETCELALALCAIGEAERGAELVAAMQHLRARRRLVLDRATSSPTTRCWPVERTTWTAAAVLLAAAALAGDHPATTAVFGGAGLPAGPDGDLAGCAQHPQRAGPETSANAAAVQRAPVDPVRRLPAVGGVREHVVDGEQATGGDVRRPAGVVRLRRLLGVAAVEEHHAERTGPQRRHVAGAADDRDDDVLEPGGVHGRAEPRQRVDPPGRAGPPATDRGTPSPAGAPRSRGGGRRHHHGAGLAGRGGEVERGLAAVAADLQQRTRAPPPARAASYSASPSSVGMKPVAASAALRSTGSTTAGLLLGCAGIAESLLEE